MDTMTQSSGQAWTWHQWVQYWTFQQQKEKLEASQRHPEVKQQASPGLSDDSEDCADSKAIPARSAAIVLNLLMLSHELQASSAQHAPRALVQFCSQMMHCQAFSRIEGHLGLRLAECASFNHCSPIQKRREGEVPKGNATGLAAGWTMMQIQQQASGLIKPLLSCHMMNGVDAVPSIWVEPEHLKEILLFYHEAVCCGQPARTAWLNIAQYSIQATMTSS